LRFILKLRRSGGAAGQCRDKIGVWPGTQEDAVMLRRADGQVGYYEGEV